MRIYMSLVKMAENTGEMREESLLKRPWDAEESRDCPKMSPKGTEDPDSIVQACKRTKEEAEFINERLDDAKSVSLTCQPKPANLESEPGVESVEPNGDNNVEVEVLPSTSGSTVAEDEEDSVSEISGLSDISMEGEGWRPMAAPMRWVQQQMQMGANPRHILRQLIPQDAVIPEGFDELTLWKIIINVITEPPKRKKLADYNTLDDVVDLIQKSQKIMILTGAGVSVSCGIPDFRSRDGIYARLHVEYPDLPDPQAMFDIDYFKKNPNPFFKFAREIYPGQFAPSFAHKFIKLIEDHGKLLRNYTQNIDTLEQVAGITKIVQCHGSFATATCMMCKHKVEAEEVRGDIMAQVIPRCPNCPQDERLAIMKPDIVFFGESLTTEFHRQMEADKDECDLLIVIGSSLKVRPVALIPNSLPGHVPQILINRETLKHLNFDVELLGDGDVIVNELCHKLGESWNHLCTTPSRSIEISRGEMSTPPADSPESFTPKENSNMSFQNAEEEDSAASKSKEDSVPLRSETGAENKRDIEEPSTLQTGQNSISEGSHVNNNHAEDTTSTSAVSFTTGAAGSSSVDNCDLQGPSQSTDGQTAKSPTMQDRFKKLRSSWKPAMTNLSSRLKDGTFLRLPPNRYVFRGAEVYDEVLESDDDERDVSSSCSNSDSECADINTQSTDIDGPSSPVSQSNGRQHKEPELQGEQQDEKSLHVGKVDILNPTPPESCEDMSTTDQT